MKDFSVMTSRGLFIFAFCVTATFAARWTGIVVDNTKYYNAINQDIDLINRRSLIFAIKGCEGGDMLFYQYVSSGGFVYVRMGDGGNTYSLMMGSPHCTTAGCDVGAHSYGTHLDCDNYKVFWARWNNWGKFEVGSDADIGSNLLMEMDYNLDGDNGVFQLRTLEVSSATDGVILEFYYYIDEEPTMLTPPMGGGTVLNVTEDAAIGTVLLTSSGQDPEGDVLTFGINGSYSDVFAWDSSTSNYILNSTLDYESQKVYYITLAAHDGYNVIYNSMALFVLDVNDEAPVVTAGSLTLLEELEVGTKLFGTFVVADPDTDQTFTYDVSGTNADYFTFDGSELKLTKRVDREVVTSLTVTVTVTDAESHTGQTDLTFTVTDINDNSPVCGSDVYFVTIAEGTADENVKILDAIDCTDADEGSHASMAASVVDGDPGGIFYFTGLELWGSPKLADYEGLSSDGYSYYLIVHVIDQPTSGPAMTGTVMIVVQVTSANEFDPTWTTPTVDGSGNFPSVTIGEDSKHGDVIVTYIATDDDDGTDGVVYYEIVSITSDTGVDGSGKFKVDRENGEMRSSGHLDVDGGISSYDVVVKAVDGGATPRETQATQQVILTGVNDNAPSFDGVPEEVTVSEDATVGTVVETLVVTDADGDTVTVTVTAGATAEFTMSGLDLVTAGTLDFETTKCYTVILEATDGHHTTPMSITVKVTDVNDETPVITPSTTLSMFELLPVGTVLYGLFSVADPDDGDSFTYSIAGTDASYFTTSASGDLEIASLVTATGATLTVDITVTDAHSHSATENLVITVVDVNDNAPQCDLNVYEINVQEGSGGATSLLSPINCVDSDSGDNAKMVARIVAGDPDSIFSFNNLELMGNPNNINYESLSASNYQYKLEVVVEDQPPEGAPLYDSLLIIVTVTGTNEFDPVFSDPVWTAGNFPEISLPEDSSPGSVVDTFTATDQDDGQDGVVKYEIVSITTDNGTVVTDEFWIDADSGAMFVGKSLDADVATGGVIYYTVVVKAIDLGATPRSVEGSLKVTLTGVNDNAPEITVSRDVTVSEAETPGYVVVDVTLADADGDTPTLTLGGTHAGSFVVSGTEIHLQNSLDYDDDTKSCISLEISASDSVHTTLETLTITVDPANDEDPVITVNPDPKMAEELPVGTVVWGIFTVSDPDEGDAFTYTLSGTDASYFTTTADGGLTIASRVDREAVQSLTITVTVEDNNAHQVSEDITITVLDINDNAPVCTATIYFQTIQEGSTSTDAKVMDAITCTDADTGTYADMDVSIVDGDASGLFYFKSDWELWGALDQINYEDLDGSNYMYHLTVQVADKATDVAAHTSIVMILLDVTGINEFAPEITSPDPAGTGSFPDVTTSEDTLSGTVLVTYVATDQDHGTDGDVTFEIVTITSDTGVDKSGTFVIDPKGGNLRVGQALDADTATGGGDYYEVVVKAVDGGTTPQSAQYTQKIILTGVNDNAPVVTDTELKFVVAEDTAGAVLVGSLTVEDPDGDSVTLTVTGSHVATFEAHASQPDIMTLGALDYETAKCYSVEVSVSDGSFTTKTTVTIAISDVIDVSPTLTPFTFITMTEELPYGTVIGQLFDLADPDLGDTMTYSIAGTDGSNFAINATTGRVFVASSIDADAGVTSLSVTVTAVDGASLTGDANIDISVIDLNEFTPVFGENVYTATVEENSASAKILDVVCTDSDTGSNGDVELFVPSTDGADTIFSVSGMELHADGTQLDYEALSGSGYLFAFILMCRDKPTEGVAMTGSVLVTVQVTGVNEFAPVWSSPSVDASGNFPGVEVSESVPPGSPVQVFVATDDDHGVDGTITYSLESAVSDTGLDSSAKFRIQPTTGSLETAMILDYEGDGAYYDIVVKATDGTTDTSGTITVTITDASDNAPKFTEEFSSAYVPCTTSMGADILTLAANDVDTVGTTIFSFKSYTGDLFDLNPSTGVIKLNKKTTQVGSDIYHTLSVLATDSGDATLTDEATVDIEMEYCGPITTTTAAPITTPPSPAACISNNDQSAVLPVRVVTAVLAVALVGILGFSLRGLLPGVQTPPKVTPLHKRKIREFERPLEPEPELELEDMTIDSSY